LRCTKIGLSPSVDIEYNKGLFVFLPPDNTEKAFSNRARLFIGNIKPGLTESQLKVTNLLINYFKNSHGFLLVK
jgi:hypothetical protein